MTASFYKKGRFGPIALTIFIEVSIQSQESEFPFEFIIVHVS
jgi:hypothetical protein